MALTKAFTKTQEKLDGFLELKNAYWRVDNVFATKEHASCTVSVNRNDENYFVPVAVKQYNFTPKLIDKNFIAQAYDHLKTLPEFADAKDC
jgi:hypothetical protein